MQRFVVISVCRAILTLFGISFMVFMLARLSGSPLDVMLPREAGPQQRAEIARLWGLDKSYPEQYVVFIENAIRGDFGRSFKWSDQNAMDLVLQHLPATLQLTLTAQALTLLIALPLGVLSAIYRGSWVDYGAKLVAMLGQSVPNFWLALVLVWVFSVGLGWFPSQGMGDVRNMVMPVGTIMAFGIAAFTRLIRSSMLEVLDTEYIKLARLKGLPESKVIWKHALRNAAIAPLAFFSTIAAFLLTGSVVVESIFNWPGVGLLAVDAVNSRDYQVVQAITLMAAAAFIAINLAVDLLYGWIDPRVRLGARG